jgi:hypothetical protein
MGEGLFVTANGANARKRGRRKGVVELTGDDDTGTTWGRSTWTGSGQFCCPAAKLERKG